MMTRQGIGNERELDPLGPCDHYIRIYSKFKPDNYELKEKCNFIIQLNAITVRSSALAFIKLSL